MPPLSSSLLAMKSLSLATIAAITIGASACRSPAAAPEPIRLNYVGSSTVAFFVREAGEALPDIDFTIDTAPESDGGERAILTGNADLAGIAREPGPTVRNSGVAAAMIGRDALAVFVNSRLPVEGLTSEELRQIFAGEITNWSRLGGPDLAIKTFLVGENSATRAVFKQQVMAGEAYAASEVVEPDSAIIGRVAETPGGIGFISFAFLDRCEGHVRALSIDGRAPSLYDFEYPIARPLYLLWRPGTPGADRFVQWAISDAGQSVVMHHYPGVGVLGSVDSREPALELGTLVVYTHTFEIIDGSIEYYPHRPYQIFSEQGEPVQRVRNHRGVNDEQPTHVSLAPGVYLIRTEDNRGKQLEFFATIRSGRTTELRADDHQDSREAP